MPNKFLYITFLLLSLSAFSQKENDSTNLRIDKEFITIKDTITRQPLDPLSPSRAAFYSAILPGLGQAYNKKYWKIPIVVGGIVGGILIYDFNNNEYHRYRDAFKSRLAGFTNDEFYGENPDGSPLATPNISNDGLIRAQEQFKRNRDLALLITIGIYALNIIDANVDAHLLQFNVDENLAIRPHFKYNERENTSNLGLTLNFKF